jgi:hypothetical protein
MPTHDALTSTAAWRQLKWHGLTSLIAPIQAFAPSTCSVTSIKKTYVSRDAPCITLRCDAEEHSVTEGMKKNAKTKSEGKE